MHALQQQNEEDTEPFRGIIQSCKCLHPRIALICASQWPTLDGSVYIMCVFSKCHEYDCMC